jgi:hypothetical protein
MARLPPPNLTRLTPKRHIFLPIQPSDHEFWSVPCAAQRWRHPVIHLSCNASCHSQHHLPPQRRLLPRTCALSSPRSQARGPRPAVPSCHLPVHLPIAAAATPANCRRATPANCRRGAPLNRSRIGGLSPSAPPTPLLLSLRADPAPVAAPRRMHGVGAAASLPDRRPSPVRFRIAGIRSARARARAATARATTAEAAPPPRRPAARRGRGWPRCASPPRARWCAPPPAAPPSPPAAADWRRRGRRRRRGVPPRDAVRAGGGRARRPRDPGPLGPAWSRCGPLGPAAAASRRGSGAQARKSLAGWPLGPRRQRGAGCLSACALERGCERPVRTRPTSVP